MPYDEVFDAYVAEQADPSASATLDHLFRYWRPDSILDVGCGAAATWLRAAEFFYPEDEVDLVGVDRPGVLAATDDPFVHEHVQECDLRNPDFRFGEHFDLVLCLEVAEHLPIEAAPVLVETLCHHAEVVLFSAAVPMQGGDGHINERWPEYWINYFNQHDFQVSGQLRWDLWYDERIAPFYRQNMLLFTRAMPEGLAALARGAMQPFVRRVVHPDQFGDKLGVRFLPG